MCPENLEVIKWKLNQQNYPQMSLLLNLAKILIKKIHGTGDYSKWISYIEDRPFNDKRYYISNQKLRELGWKIDISLEDGLDLLINDI